MKSSCSTDPRSSPSSLSKRTARGARRSVPRRRDVACIQGGSFGTPTESRSSFLLRDVVDRDARRAARQRRRCVFDLRIRIPPRATLDLRRRAARSRHHNFDDVISRLLPGYSESRHSSLTCDGKCWDDMGQYSGLFGIAVDEHKVDSLLQRTHGMNVELASELRLACRARKRSRPG